MFNYALAGLDAKRTSMAWNLGAMAAETPQSSTSAVDVSGIVNNATNTDLASTGGQGLYTKTQGVGRLSYQIVFGLVGIGVLIAIIVKGFQFAMASAADRDEKKKSFIRVAIGSTIVFCATGIATMLATFGNNLFTATN